MRTLLAAVLVAVLIVAGVAIVVPLIARPMIVSAVQSASPFGHAPLDIEVDVNVFGLLTGSVDRIHVRGTDLKRADVAVGALDVTLTDVATTGRAFRKAAGTLASIEVPLADGTTITIDQVRLDGASSATTAVVTLGHDAALHWIGAAFADGGIDAGGIELGPGTVTFEAFGARVDVPIGIEDGAIVVVDPFGTGSLELVRPAADDAWLFTGVGVTAGGLTIDATVDAEQLLAGS